MAYNPFHGFRKHKKPIFAALTILCMVTFVLAGNMGQGDFFDAMMRAFGGEGRSPRVATLYGKGINFEEINQVADQRRLAHRYMASAVDRANENVFRDIEAALAEDRPPVGKDPEPANPEQNFDLHQQQEIQMVLRTLRQLTMREDFLEMMGQSRAGLLAQVRQSLPRLSAVSQELKKVSKLKQADLVDNLVAALAAMDQRSQQAPGQLYFGGTFSLDDLLDFRIWQHQADRLGIQLTPEDINRAMATETLGQLTDQNRREIERGLQLNRGSADQLVKALGDEFRVRMARAALMGHEAGSYLRTPALITPDEFRQFYQTNRTEVSVALLPFSVREFLPKVTEKPTDAELEELFKKYKEQEPFPDSRTPGFKQPRRVTVEWAAGRPDSAHYRQAADHLLLGHLTVHPVGPLDVLTRFLPYHEGFVDMKGFGSTIRLPALTDPNFVLRLYTSTPQPANIAAAAGLAAGPNGLPSVLPSALLSALVSYQTVPVARDGQAMAPIVARESASRVGVGGTLILAGAMPGPFSLAGLAYYSGEQEQYLPLDVVQPQLLNRVRQKLAQEMLTANLGTVRKELEALRWRPEEAKKYVGEAVKKYGLRRGQTEKPRDHFDIGGDAGLKPLRDAYLRTQAQRDPRGRGFPQNFFGREPAYSPEQLTFPSDEEPSLYWKTSDKAAYVPSFEEVKAQVEQAWKLEKARALALKEAEEVAAKARKAGGDPARVLIDGSKAAGTLFTLDSVARLKPRVAAFGSQVGMQYQPYQVPEDKIEYPPADLVDTLTALTKEKDVTVVEDRPGMHVYVAALMNRQEPSLNDFLRVYGDASAASFRRDPLLDYFEHERRERYRQAVLAQFRGEAGLVIEEKSPEAREQLEKELGRE